ncbi:hypothetical protein AYI69_g9414 [Smittium culicis]|uniref:Uncharacterized protein n=1 Tax=Smittium culicis TaxID=133412 RepID=A0A1R1XCQ5_9FUNG|nr:hypothetical protein AYI69_g9414 [Smittium culicis]
MSENLAVYAPSMTNPSDAPSRLTAHLEWGLSISVFKQIDKVWDPNTLSLIVGKEKFSTGELFKQIRG